MYIVIEGIIGAGKSTLALELSRRLQAIYFAEEFETNPCLKKFYSNPNKFAWCTEKHFLEQRYQDLLKISEKIKEGEKVVSDFGFIKGKAFGMINLSSDEYDDYIIKYDRLDQNLPKADLTIFLDAQPNWAFQNIMKRNRPMESTIEEEYLSNLAKSYQHFMRKNLDSEIYTIHSEELFELSCKNIADKIEEEIKMRFG